MKKLVLGVVAMASCGRQPASPVDGQIRDGGADSGSLDGLDVDARTGSDVPDPVDPPSTPCPGVLGFPDVPFEPAPNQPMEAVADVDGDGIIDLVYGDSSTLHVRRGNGNGTFKSDVAYALSGYPQGLVLVDINADGKPDVITTSSATNSIDVLLNHGDGTFGAVVSTGLETSLLRSQPPI